MPTNIQYTPEFLDFWSEYPRRIGKFNAFNSWQKIDFRFVAPQYIIESVRKQKNGCQLTGDKQYIPHPATWLNQRRWEDDAERKCNPGDEDKSCHICNAPYDPKTHKWSRRDPRTNKKMYDCGKHRKE
jgi:hypothetical protein